MCYEHSSATVPPNSELVKDLRGLVACSYPLTEGLPLVADLFSACEASYWYYHVFIILPVGFLFPSSRSGSPEFLRLGCSMVPREHYTVEGKVGFPELATPCPSCE